MNLLSNQLLCKKRSILPENGATRFTFKVSDNDDDDMRDIGITRTQKQPVHLLAAVVVNMVVRERRITQVSEGFWGLRWKGARRGEAWTKEVIIGHVALEGVRSIRKIVGGRALLE